jgi:hypothetical protein
MYRERARMAGVTRSLQFMRSWIPRVLQTASHILWHVYARSPASARAHPRRNTDEPILCCHVIWVTFDGVFGLDIGFIDHLHTNLSICTCNYSAIANLHNLQINTAHAKFFPACCVFTSRSLVTASNSGDSSASVLKSSLNGGSLPTDSFVHRFS